MEMKEYQASALDAFTRWLDALAEAQTQSDAAVAALQNIPGVAIPGDIRNYPKTAWEQLKQSGEVAENSGPYVDRTDEAGRPISHVCFKVPTGGGKTLLAAAALQRLHRQTGLVLWIMPTSAIYEQTKRDLKNKEHPYRQLLEIASGGRVKLMEKDDPFARADAANYMCVMLLSLPQPTGTETASFCGCSATPGATPRSSPTTTTP